MCGLCNDALRNEQAWITIAQRAGALLEKAGLALPEGELREEALSMHAEISTTRELSAKKGPVTRDYKTLKTPGAVHALAFPL